MLPKPKHSRELEARFEQLVAQHQTLIYGVCYAFFPLDKFYRDETEQQVMIRLWRGMESMPTFAHKGEEAAWGYTIVRHEACRQWKRQLQQQKRFNTTLPPDTADDDRHATQLRELYEAIHLLDDSASQVLLLYLEGYSQEEMSQQLQISMSALNMRIVRAKEKLKNLFNIEI